MSDVFISYASEDRTRVQPIVEQLQDQGWSVWWDRDIAVGAGFEQTIDEQIQAARCVVVAWSERSVSSRWVRNEALEGLERDILIPLMLDEVRVPVAFRQSQSIDFSGQLHFDRAMQALLGAIAGMTATGTTLPETIAAPPASDKPSIAVLPFRSHAPDEREEFIITCLAEDLGANLAQLPGFFVISPRTTAAFAGRAIDPVDVGRQLRVRYVVDGSLRRAGEQLLVAAQLTDATTGMQLYAERIESSAAELDELNDELVRGLVSCIEPELMRAEVKRISSRPIEHLDAWSLCRKGIGVLQTRGWHEDVLSETASLLDRASEIDPDFALPWAVKSVLLGVGSRMGLYDRYSSSLRDSSIEAAERGIALANDDSQVLGYAGCALADWGEVERSMPVLDQSIRRNPCNAQAWMARALAWRDQGDLQRALDEARKGLSLSPRDISVAAWLFGYAAVLLQAGQLEEALLVTQEARRRDPRLFAVTLLITALRLLLGDPKGAASAMADTLRLRPELTRQEVQRLFGSTMLHQLFDESGLIEALPDS
jgi:adenylate cyclase